MTDTAESPRFYPGQFVNDLNPGSDDEYGMRIVMQVGETDGHPSLKLGHPASESGWYAASDFKHVTGDGPRKQVGETYGEPAGPHFYHVVSVDRTSDTMTVAEHREANGRVYVHPYSIPAVASLFGGAWTHLSLIAVMEQKTRENAELSRAARAVAATNAAEGPNLFKTGSLVTPQDNGSSWDMRVVLSRRANGQGRIMHLLSTGDGNTAEYDGEQLKLVAPSVQHYLAAAAAKERLVMDEYKAEVGRIARKAKNEHGWCEVVDDLLRDMDVPVLTEMITAVMTITVEVDLRPDGSDAMSKLNDLDWFKRSTSVTDSDNQLEISGDLDFEDNPEIRLIGYEVTSVMDASFGED